MTYSLAPIALLAVMLGYAVKRGDIHRVLSASFVSLLSCTATYLIYAFPQEGWMGFIATVILGVPVGACIGYIIKRFVEENNTKSSYFRIARETIVSDTRVVAVIIGLVVSIIMTFYFARLAAQNKADPGGFWMSFYSSWVGSILFFTIVGSITVIVALYRPEKDVFLSRVKILLGGKSGVITDFVSEELKKSGCIAKETSRLISIRDYDKKLNAILVHVTHKSTAQNIFPDVPVTGSSSLHVVPDTIEGLTGIHGEILSARICGKIESGLPLPISDEFKRKWTFNVDPGGDGLIEYEYWCWYRLDKDHRFTPGRFTESVSIEFSCRCKDENGPMGIVVICECLGKRSEYRLNWDESACLPVFRDVYPEKVLYEFRVGLQEEQTAIAQPVTLVEPDKGC